MLFSMEILYPQGRTAPIVSTDHGADLGRAQVLFHVRNAMQVFFVAAQAVHGVESLEQRLGPIVQQ
jgi:hypothetical protein